MCQGNGRGAENLRLLSSIVLLSRVWERTDSIVRKSEAAERINSKGYNTPCVHDKRS